jgi:hypothetical protein
MIVADDDSILANTTLEVDVRFDNDNTPQEGWIAAVPVPEYILRLS